MNNNSKNLKFVQSYSYFKNIPQQPSFLQFEKHLKNLQQFLEDRQSVNKATEKIIQGLMTILCISYKRISQTDKYSMQQYLMIKFIKMMGIVHDLFFNKCQHHDPANKNIYAILFHGNVTNMKKILQLNDNNHLSLLEILLYFNKSLLDKFISCFRNSISDFYPGLYSVFSKILRFQFINLKNMAAILQNLKIMITVIPITKQTFSHFTSIIKQKQNSQYLKINDFQLSCLNKLIEDIKYVVQKYFQFQFNYQVKLQEFSQFLIKHFWPYFKQISYGNDHFKQLQSLMNNQNFSILIELFRAIVNFSQITQNELLQLQVNPYFARLIQQENKRRFIQTCHALKVQASINIKQRELKQLIKIMRCIQIPYEESNQLFKQIINFLKHIFHIKQHNLITIPSTSFNIPLQELASSTTINNYKIKGLNKQYKKQLNTMILEVIPFYQLELGLIELVHQLFENMTALSRENVLKYFIDELLEYEYKLDMSLTSFYQYLCRLIIIRFLVSGGLKLKKFSIISNLFNLLANKTQSVVKLKPSYIEEEIMISITLQIIYASFQHLRNQYSQTSSVSNRIKLTQATILVIQKILNSITQKSYLIKLISIHSLLNFTNQQPLCKALKPTQTTLLQRNKTNMLLVRALLQLTQLNQIDYEDLTFQYLNYKNCQSVLLYLIVRISIESCRKCILAAEKWWLLLSKETIQYLNCKQIKRSTNQGQSFFVKDQQNVKIANALGVIIIQLSDKWIFYLRSQKRQILIDIMINLLKTNPSLIFFRSFFTKILKELHKIICECLGYDKQEISTINNSVKDSIKYSLHVQLQNRSTFYNRLKIKIYNLLIEIPKQNLATWQKDDILNLYEIIQNEENVLKKAYLFNGRVQFKEQYELLKKVCHFLKMESK